MRRSVYALLAFLFLLNLWAWAVQGMLATANDRSVLIVSMAYLLIVLILGKLVYRGLHK